MFELMSKRALRLLATFCTICLFMLPTQESRATHVMGADIIVQCINSCTVRVHMRAYRDCGGASGISPSPLQFVPQTAGCAVPTAIGPWSMQVTTEVTPICNTASTKCTNSSASLNGVQEYYWWRDYNICQAGNCIFNIQWSWCCRNNAITSGFASQNFFINGTTFNNTLTGCNNSPIFSNPPVPYICAGQPYTFNQGAFDPDGDSLSYSLGPCYTQLNQQGNYATGYSLADPMGTGWKMSIDPVTGDVTMTPQPGPQVVGVFCVYVTEWRNGVPINTIVRDMQMTVIPCPSNPTPNTTGIQNLQGGTLTNPFQFTACLNQNVSFQIPINDASSNQVIKAFWNQNIAGATFSNANNPNEIDTIYGTSPNNTPTAQFNWQPTAVGTYTFLITMQDDACPIFGQNQFTIKIDVIGGLNGATAQHSLVNCLDYSFVANPGTSGNGPYTYLWQGSGNVSVNPNNSQQSFNHTYPGPGVYPYSCTITDAFGCTETIHDTITILTGPIANAGPDITLCSQHPVQVGAPPIAGQVYNWVGMGVAPTNIANPTVTWNNPGPGPDTLNYTLIASDPNTGCNAIDFLTLVVNPTPVGTVNAPSNICVGDSAVLTASGGTSYTWSTNETGSSITVYPSQTSTYTVTIEANGCASLPIPHTVQVDNGPLALISGPSSVCPGENAVCTVVGGNGWNWTTGHGLQTITIGPIMNDTTIGVIASLNGCAGPQSDFTIAVDEVPTANFTAPAVCDDQNMTFNDGSTIPVGGIVAWNWNFGDPGSGTFNNTSGSQNPGHLFSGAGTYNVELVVTSDKGCKDTITQPMTVNALPLTDFDVINACEGDTHNFLDLTPGNISGWSWTFGDGGGSQSQNPVHNYQAPNAYNVTLTVTDDNGCQKDQTKTVFLWPNPTADFTYENKCFNTITEFTDRSVLDDPYGTSIQGWSWNFGDPQSGAANTSSQVNPVHNYPVGATYQATITVVSDRGCTNTITAPVNVAEINPPIGIGDTVCPGYGAAPRATNVADGITIEWYDEETGGAVVGTGLIHYSAPIFQGRRFWIGMLDKDGCRSNRVPVWVRVHPNPVGEFMVSNSQLAIPNAIADFGWTPTWWPGDSLTFTWDFGDGSTSNDQFPVHQYQHEGQYAVSLNIVNEFGCQANYLHEFIDVDQTFLLIVPNAFTPNGDGINDEFTITHRLITDLNTQIFDRWGRLIYETNDINFSWRGLDPDGSLMSEGVYVYNMQGYAYDGTKVTKTGTVTLIK